MLSTDLSDKLPPVLLTGFNRPKHLLQNLKRLQNFGVSKLYVSIDGPRKHNNKDIDSNREIRLILAREKQNFKQFELRISENNLGCRMGMETAINWFFEHEEMGAIIEDDCFVNLSFLRYSNILLEKYANTESIGHISGSNFHKGKILTETSYYFSAIPHIWGWATWKRAWAQYDPEIDINIVYQLNGYYNNKHDLERYKKEFEHTLSGKHDTWDFRWIYSMWKNKKLSITPQVNMVSNMGFGEESTHTKSENHPLSKLSLNELNFPLNHPQQISIFKKADQKLFKKKKKDLNYLKGQLYPYAKKYFSNALNIYKKLKS